MELKEVSRIIAIKVWKFQSHLYGIESASAMKLDETLQVFQSHLYGIESCDACRMAAADRVSIAPLWN